MVIFKENCGRRHIVEERKNRYVSSIIDYFVIINCLRHSMLSSTKVSTTMCAMCTTRFRCASGNPSSTYTYIFRNVRARNVASLFPWLWLPRESVYWFIDLATLFTYIALLTLHIALFFLLHVHACEPNACKFAIRIDSCPFYSSDQSVCEGIRKKRFSI